MAKQLQDYNEATAFDLANDVFWLVKGFAPSPSAAGTDHWMSGESLLLALTSDLNVQTYGSLDSALSVIGTNKARLLIPVSTTVSNNTTIPENVTTVITGQGQFSINATKTLTINGPLETPLRQIFTGSGSVVIGSRVEKAFPQWWGAAGDARHFDTASINSSSNTLNITGGNLTNADNGKMVAVKGAGASGATLITTISTVTGATSATLAAAASTAVSNTRAIIGTNDTAAVAAAATAAVGKELYFVRAKYLIRMTATGGGAVVFGNNSTASGEGSGSIIYCVGSDAQNNGDIDHKTAFYIPSNVSKVTIKDLHFIGENNASSFIEAYQNQSNIIGGFGTGSSDVTVTHCIFEETFGFPIHDWNTVRYSITHNRFLYCANGINVNGDYSYQCHNFLYKTEGIEASGSYSKICYNTLILCGVSLSGSGMCLSIGGHTSPGSSMPGVLVQGNQIISPYSGGLVLADAAYDCLVCDNLIIGTQSASYPGLQLVSSGYNPVLRNTVRGNKVIDSNFHGVLNSSDTELIFENNQVYTTGGTTVSYAFIDYAGGARLINNTLKGSTKDLAPGNGTYLRGNKFSSPPAFDFSIPGKFTPDSDVKGSDVASAATITATGRQFHVTGTTGISAISTTNVPPGTEIEIIFDGALTITHGSTLKLAGSTNFTTTADTRMRFSYDGVAWREVGRVQP